MSYDNDSAKESQGSYLEELLGRVLAEAPEEQPDAAPQRTTQTAGEAADPISALLQNPELIAKLPTILSAAKPIMEILGNLNRQSIPVSATAVSKPQKSGDAKDSKQKSPHQDRHVALLCAMKPYLSNDRQKTVDYILKLRNLGDILKSLQ